jgi:hypothetical protein
MKSTNIDAMARADSIPEYITVSGGIVRHPVYKMAHYRFGTGQGKKG